MTADPGGGQRAVPVLTNLFNWQCKTCARVFTSFRSYQEDHEVTQQSMMVTTAALHEQTGFTFTFIRRTIGQDIGIDVKNRF